MNYKKCISIVEKMSKKAGRLPLYHLEREGDSTLVSDSVVLYRIKAPSPFVSEGAWVRRNMADFISGVSLEDAEEAWRTAVSLEVENRVLRLFLSENRFIWVNEMYLDPLKRVEFRYYLKKYRGSDVLLITDLGKNLHTLICGVQLERDSFYYEEFRRLLKMID